MVRLVERRSHRLIADTEFMHLAIADRVRKKNPSGLRRPVQFLALFHNRLETDEIARPGIQQSLILGRKRADTHGAQVDDAYGWPGLGNEIENADPAQKASTISSMRSGRAATAPVTEASRSHPSSMGTSIRCPGT